MLARVWFDFLHGGSPWRQGDWLINSAAGLVRRGFMGDGMIALGDLTGTNLLAVTIAVQTGLFLALLWLLWVLARDHPNKPLILLLAASPAFLPIFWAGDVQGIMRKELFGFLAFGCLTLAGFHVRPARFLPMLAVILFTLGCIGNILHAFLAPALIYGLYLLWDSGRITRAAYVNLSVVTAAMALFWFGFASVYREVTDAAAICAPLLSRGFAPDFCAGALSWIVTGYVNHLSELSARLTPLALAQFGTVAVLALIPVAVIARRVNAPGRFAWMVALAFLPLLPLYAITTDWGRWLNISYMALAFLVLQAERSGHLRLPILPRQGLMLGLLAFALLISHVHGIGWIIGGAVRSVVMTATAFI